VLHTLPLTSYRGLASTHGPLSVVTSPQNAFLNLKGSIFSQEVGDFHTVNNAYVMNLVVLINSSCKTLAMKTREGNQQPR